jgi:hypothetical protein
MNALAELHPHRLQRRLVACPFPEPTLADARTPPFRAVADFAAMHELVQHSDGAPILLGYAQYYRLLELLAVQAQALDLDAPLLLEVTRPLGVALPATLLAPQVLIADHIEAELAFWRQHARRGVLAARLRIRREPHEYGDNTLQLELWSRSPQANPLPALMQALGRSGAWRSEPPSPTPQAAALAATLERSI